MTWRSGLLARPRLAISWLGENAWLKGMRETNDRSSVDSLHEPYRKDRQVVKDREQEALTASLTP